MTGLLLIGLMTSLSSARELLRAAIGGVGRADLVPDVLCLDNGADVNCLALVRDFIEEDNV